MRLFEHPDFEQAILRAAEHFHERKLRPAIIEKDYYVTEALRVIATTSGARSFSRAVRVWPRDGTLSNAFRKTLTSSLIR